MITTILFDFWGTLVENGVWSPIKQVKNILKIDLPFSEYVVRMERAMMTQKFDSLSNAFKAICQEFKIEIHEEKIAELVGLWNKSWMLAQPYPEVVEELKKLGEKYKLILISNTDCFSVTQVLDKFNLRKLFDRLFLSCEVHQIKTDKNFFKLVLEEMRLSPEDCLMIGDSILSDMRAAEKAGIKAVLINRKGRRDYPTKIESLKDIERFLTN